MQNYHHNEETQKLEESRNHKGKKNFAKKNTIFLFMYYYKTTWVLLILQNINKVKQKNRYIV